MARVITALETSIDHGTEITQQAIFWVPVPAEYVPFVADPTFTSALTGDLAPTEQELEILRSGAYREVEDTVSVSMTTGARQPLGKEAVLSALAAALSARYVEHSGRVSLANPYVLRGSTRDAAGTWTIRGVAPPAPEPVPEPSRLVRRA